MNRYRDIFESTYNWTEAKDSQFLGTLVFSWGRSDVFNKNHRYYPHKVFASAVNGLNTRIEKANVPGQVDHPIGGGSTRLADVSHILTKVWMDKNKVAWAEAKFLKTQKAKDALEIIKSDVKIGASLRGFGEIDKEGKVKSGLEIKTVDLVVDPSFGDDARIDQNSVIESYVPEEEAGFTNEDLKHITNAMNGLSDATIEMIQEKLEKKDGIVMTESRIQGLILWIKCSKDNPNIAPFNEWFENQQKLFAENNPNFREELNDGLRRQANVKSEKRMAGFSFGVDKLRLEQRQKNIDEAFRGKRMSTKTVSRLFAEAVLAGYKGSRADWIKEFGF